MESLVLNRKTLPTLGWGAGIWEQINQSFQTEKWTRKVLKSGERSDISANSDISSFCFLEQGNGQVTMDKCSYRVTPDHLATITPGSTCLLINTGQTDLVFHTTC